MKVLNLQCAGMHNFEGWFGSEEDYQSQRERDLVACPLCANTQVRQTVYKALEDLGDLVQFPKTQGAFYVLMKLPGLKVGVEPIAFNRAMTEKFKVASIPGFAFGLTQTHEANYQRLSYGALEAASVAEGVQRYVAAVQDWYSAY